MRYTVTTQIVNVLGYIWQPTSSPCAMTYTLSAHDLEQLGDPANREDVQNWIDSHSGDFSQITDFRADFTIGETDIIHDWADPESEMLWSDAMGDT